ncbi:hypothetical protein QFC19_006273 [Naganishia cerealis]|uniref:Uncharacterized protein n=1 Tax=Naganishia cerealis TaxID=610337 RepID=A0ACC2VI60_9TREE|nr:hypothetical protein QFC19_006273 [Naganishia cerealis]
MAEEAPMWQELLKTTLSKKSDYSVALALATLTLDGRPSVRFVGLKEVISIPSSSAAVSHSSIPLDTSPVTPARGSEVSALVFTTDIRSPKCAEIQRNPCISLSMWSGETGIQLRIDGAAYLYKPGWSQEREDISERWIRANARSSSDPSVATAENIIRQADLDTLSRALFDGLHPRTRAWHTRGIPGKPIDAYTQNEKDKWLAELQAGEAAETEAARNFALLLVVPQEVDIVQILTQGHDRRWHWKLLDDMTWAATELVP